MESLQCLLTSIIAFFPMIHPRGTGEAGGTSSMATHDEAASSDPRVPEANGASTPAQALPAAREALAKAGTPGDSGGPIPSLLQSLKEKDERKQQLIARQLEYLQAAEQVRILAACERE